MSRRRSPRTEPPDELSLEQWAALERWVREKEPWASAELGDLVDSCLDHHRAVGNLMANWTAACRTWVRNERKWRRRPGGDGGNTRTAPQGRGGAGRGGLVEAMRDGARELGLFPELFD